MFTQRWEYIHIQLHRDSSSSIESLKQSELLLRKLYFQTSLALWVTTPLLICDMLGDALGKKNISSVYYVNFVVLDAQICALLRLEGLHGIETTSTLCALIRGNNNKAIINTKQLIGWKSERLFEKGELWAGDCRLMMGLLCNRFACGFNWSDGWVNLDWRNP